MRTPVCPACGAELVEVAPAGATCARGCRLMRDEAGRLVAATTAPPDEGEHDVHQLQRNQATRLVRIGRQGELWHTPDGEAWATIGVGGHRENWPIQSRHFREWLARQFYEQFGRAPGAQALQDALSVLAGDAKYGGPNTQSTRGWPSTRARSTSTSPTPSGVRSRLRLTGGGS
jgi:hypothetical protein